MRRRTGDAGSRLLSNLTTFINTILAGSVPRSILPAFPFRFRTLSAFNKKDGGIQPIAVGDTLRRLAAKCATRSVQDKFSGILGPSQLGFGTPGGCEAAVHATRRITGNPAMVMFF